MPAMEETRDNASPASAPSGQAWLAPTPDSSARAAAAMSQDAISVVAPETLALATPTAVSATAITGDGAGTQISDDRVPVRCSPRKKTPTLAAVKVAAGVTKTNFKQKSTARSKGEAPKRQSRWRLQECMVAIQAATHNMCMCISQSNSSLLCSILYCQCLCPYGQRCSDANDGLFERRVVSVYNVYLHILCMIETGKDIRFSSSVKNLHNMHLSRRLHRSTPDGLLMVAQRKGALNIDCILARFMHI